MGNNIGLIIKKLLRPPNSDGLINWLRQPGLIHNQPQKTMREKFNPLIKSYAPGLILLPRQSQ
jgi:hypothetical protein